METKVWIECDWNLVVDKTIEVLKKWLIWILWDWADKIDINISNLEKLFELCEKFLNNNWQSVLFNLEFCINYLNSIWVNNVMSLWVELIIKVTKVFYCFKANYLLVNNFIEQLEKLDWNNNSDDKIYNYINLWLNWILWFTCSIEDINNLYSKINDLFKITWLSLNYRFYVETLRSMWLNVNFLNLWQVEIVSKIIVWAKLYSWDLIKFINQVNNWNWENLNWENIITEKFDYVKIKNIINGKFNWILWEKFDNNLVWNVFILVAEKLDELWILISIDFAKDILEKNWINQIDLTENEIVLLAKFFVVYEFTTNNFLNKIWDLNLIDFRTSIIKKIIIWIFWNDINSQFNDQLINDLKNRLENYFSSTNKFFINVWDSVLIFEKYNLNLIWLTNEEINFCVKLLKLYESDNVKFNEFLMPFRPNLHVNRIKQKNETPDKPRTIVKPILRVYKPSLTVIHWCHLQAIWWKDLVLWFDVWKLGRGPTWVKSRLFEQHPDSKLFWGTWASRKDDLLEAEYTVKQILDQIDRLIELLWIEINPYELEELIKQYSIIDLACLTTETEAKNALKIAVDNDIKVLKIVSSPFHVLRCIKVFIQEIVNQRLDWIEIIWVPAQTDLLESPVIVEPPHRWDLPAFQTHLYTGRMFWIMRQWSDVFAKFLNEFGELLIKYWVTVTWDPIKY